MYILLSEKLSKAHGHTLFLFAFSSLSALALTLQFDLTFNMVGKSFDFYFLTKNLLMKYV